MSAPEGTPGPRPGAVAPTLPGAHVGAPGPAPDFRAHLFASDPTQWHILRDRFLHQLDTSLEGGLHTLAAASTPMGLPMRKPLKILWNGVFHKALDDILEDPSSTNGWVWLFVLPKLVLHSSNANGLSVLRRLRLLLDGDFSTLWADFLLLMQPDRTPPRTTVRSRRQRQGRAVRLAHQGRLRDSLKALTSTAPPLAPASVWSEVSALFPAARVSPLSERLTDTLHAWTPPVPTPALDPPNAEAVRQLIASLPTGKSPGPSGLRSDHLTHLPDATYASLARLLQLILEGRALPQIACRLLSNSKLLVFPKHDDHGSRTGIRPIGVPELLRKLTGKWILKVLRLRMADFFAPLQVGIALSGGCELAVLPTRLNLEADDCGLLSLDFSNAFNTVNRQVIMDIWSRIFPEALPFVRAIYDTPPQTFAAGGDWTTPHHISVEEGVQQGDPLGPSLFASALQLILVTAHRATRLSDTPVEIRAYLDDVSVTGTPIGVSSILADIAALSSEINLELNLRKCAWWPGLLPPDTGTPPALQRLHRPEGHSLLSIPFGQAEFVKSTLDTRLQTQASLAEELLQLAEQDPHVAVTLLRFCVGPSLNYWLRALPLHWGAYLAAEQDRITLKTVERLVHGFGLQRASTLRSQVERQVTLPTRMGGLGLSHGSKIQPTAVVAAWTNAISTLIPFGDCALEHLRQGLLQASADYGRRSIGELTTICEEAADSVHASATPHSVPIIWDLLLAIRTTQDYCSWDLDGRDTPDYVLKARSLADWHSLLSTDARLPPPTPDEIQQSTLEDHPSPLSPPMFLQSLLSRAVHWRTRCELELSASGARLAQLLSLGSQLSGLWLQVIPSQARHRMVPAVFRYALRVYLGLPIPGGSLLSTRRCQDCHAVVDTLGSHWLSTCPASRAAFTRRHTAVNHSIRAALHEAGYTTTLEPLLMDPDPHQDHPGLRADLLVFGIDGQPDTYVDVAITCPTAPSFLEGTQARRGKAAHMKFQQKHRKYASTVRAQPGGVGLQPHFLPLVWETFGFTHAKSASWLDRQLKHVPGVRNRLLREISWVLWRSSGAILERAYRRLCWFHSHQPEFLSAAM